MNEPWPPRRSPSAPVLRAYRPPPAPTAQTGHRDTRQVFTGCLLCTWLCTGWCGGIRLEQDRLPSPRGARSPRQVSAFRDSKLCDFP